MLLKLGWLFKSFTILYVAFQNIDEYFIPTGCFYYFLMWQKARDVASPKVFPRSDKKKPSNMRYNSTFLHIWHRLRYITVMIIHEWKISCPSIRFDQEKCQSYDKMVHIPHHDVCVFFQSLNRPYYFFSN